MGKLKKTQLIKRLVLEMTADHFLDVLCEFPANSLTAPSPTGYVFDWLFVKDWIHIVKVCDIRRALVYMVMNILFIRR